MNGQKDGVALIGRIALAAIFVLSGLQKLVDFTGTVTMIAGAGVPLPMVAAAVAVVIELGGGLAIFAGWMTRVAALAIVVFLIIVSPIFHNFWTMEGEARMMNQVMFLKNVSMLGGFLLLMAFGPGRYSVDKS